MSSIDNAPVARTFAELMAYTLAGQPCTYVGDDSGLLEDLDESSCCLDEEGGEVDDASDLDLAL